MASPPRIRPEELLEHTRWLRRLAHSLVAEPAVAEDLVQDTWAAALRRPPAADRPLRPWLREVARNLARFRWRSERNRGAREQSASLAAAAAAASASAASSPEALLERIETFELLTRLVAELDEPFRSTLLLRYVEDLTPAEIARRLEVPAGTVRWRLKEGLDRLRLSLDVAHRGDRRAWALALAPLAKGLVMKGTSKLVAAMLVLLLLLGGVIGLVVASSGSGADDERDSLAEAKLAHAAAGRAIRGDGGREGDSAGAPADPASTRLPAWWGQPGGRPQRIAGRVTFLGAPVAGATVRLTSELTHAGWLAPAVRLTGGDGQFDFGEHVADQYNVSASAPERAAAQAQIDLRDRTAQPASDQLELVLGSCDSAIFGRVIDASGTPLARVRLLRDDVIGPVTDEQGRYELCLPREDTRVFFRADGYGAVVLVVGVPGRVRRDVVLVPEAIVEGRAVSAESGAPIADAHVWLAPDEWGRERTAAITTRSDAEGRFRIAGVSPGRHRVGGHAEAAQAIGTVVTVSAGAVVDDVELLLEARATVHGRVVRAGQPVAGALVSAAQVSPRSVSATAVSQEDGSFVLARVPLGELVFSAPPYAVRAPATFVVERAEDTAVTLEVEALGAIRGTVRRGGEPVAGARVSARGAGPGVTTDATGRYQLVGVDAGRHDVLARHDGLGAGGASRSVTLARGETRDGVDLSLDRGARISGVVVDQHQQPVAGALVRFRSGETGGGDAGEGVSDAEGRFTCASLAGGGTYRAEVLSSPWSNVAYRAAIGTPFPGVPLEDGAAQVEGVRLVIADQRGAIRGEVVDAGGAPVPDARVRAIAFQAGAEPHFTTWLSLPTGVSDAVGAFTIADLPRGTYALEARAPDGSEAILRPVEVDAAPVTLTLVRPGAIEGRLVGFRRRPLVYAQSIANPSRVPRGVVEGETFRLRDLAPGAYTLAAQAGDEGEAVPVVVRAGEVTRVTLTSRGTGSFAGRVLEWDSKAPVAGARCHALVRAGDMVGMTDLALGSAPRSDGEGRFVLARVPAGDVYVRCYAGPELGWGGVPLTVQAGQGAGGDVFVVRSAVTRPGWFGADLDDESPTPVGRFVRVEPGSPAARAGLRVDDRLLAIDGAPVANVVENVPQVIANHPVGSRCTLTVARAGATRTLTVVIGAR